MSDGNKKRDYRVFETLYNRLLTHYSHLLSKHHQSHIIKEIKDRNIKLIDSSIISLCLSMFDWAKFRTAKGGIKIHTCWDDTMMIPEVVNISEAKLHDRYGLSQLVFSKGTVVVKDRTYFDFGLMLQRIKASNLFITRIKSNTRYTSLRELELPDQIDQDILKDEIIILSSPKAAETDIKLFFKSIKQNLQIKTFVGTSENAVKSQIYIALITYLLLQLIERTIAKKKHAFSNFVEKIKICLCFYITLDYACNSVNEGAKKIRGKPQIKINFEEDLFSVQKQI